MATTKNILGGIASPNPTYPSPIKSVTGNNNVVVSNKNLVFSTISGKTINNNGSVSNSNDFDIHLANVTEGTTYTVTNGATGLVYTYFTDTTLTTNIFNTRYALSNTTTFTATATGIVVFRTNKNYSTPQLEQGSTATPYEEHKEQTLPLNLASGQKMMLGDYLADDGIHHVRRQLVLTGTEWCSQPWISDTSEIFVLYGRADSKVFNSLTTDIICKSSHYVATFHDGGVGSIWNYRNNDNYPFLIAINTNINSVSVHSIYIKHKGITTVEDFKAYLAQQYANGTPVTIEYELDDSVLSSNIEDYTTEQQTQWNNIKKATSYNDTTIITSTYEEGNAQMILKAVAYKDTVQELKNAILSLGGNV